MQTLNPTSSSSAQERVARRVTTIVLTGTCLFGILGLAIGIIAMIHERGGIAGAKEILQILFATILPLFGTWIGTILAYYFSKENLQAANQTVQHLVNQLSSQQKLDTIKAKDVMIPADKLKFITYTETDDPKLNLKVNFLDYLKKEGISRVLLVDENRRAKYVLHKSVIESFISTQFFDFLQSPDLSTTQVRELTLADLKQHGDEQVQRTLRNGVKFVSQTASLSTAKLLMQNTPECADIFITQNGLSDEPILGWITDKTITENSIVD